MFKSVIAVTTALSLTLATAAPVQAAGIDRDDAAKLFIGLAAVAVLGAAINNDTSSTSTQTYSNNRQNRSQSNRIASNSRRSQATSCVKTVQTRHGTQRVYAQNCYR